MSVPVRGSNGEDIDKISRYHRGTAKKLRDESNQAWTDSKAGTDARPNLWLVPPAGEVAATEAGLRLHVFLGAE